jgi:intracellular septation protein A
MSFSQKKVTVEMHVIKRILNKNFVLSVICPIMIFSIFEHFKMNLIGIIFAGTWSVGVVLTQFIQERKLNFYGIIGAIFSVISLVGTVISRNPTFYLASPIVSDSLLALVFLGSLLIGKPLIQIFAEQEMKDAFPEEFRKTTKYKSAWKLLTLGWGILSISQALLRVVLLYSVSMELYFSISTIYGNVTTPLFLLFSFWFPKWYWERTA